MEIKDSDVGFFNCPMDLLYRIVEEGVIDLRKHKKGIPKYTWRLNMVSGLFSRIRQTK